MSFLALVTSATSEPHATLSQSERKACASAFEETHEKGQVWYSQTNLMYFPLTTPSVLIYIYTLF